jgi:hypothetical protein
MMHVENKNISPNDQQPWQSHSFIPFLEWAGDACEHHAWQNQRAGAQQHYKGERTIAYIAGRSFRRVCCVICCVGPGDTL